MTYKAEIQLKFDSFYTPDSSSPGIVPDDDFLLCPTEEHFLISALAEDLSPKQYFKLVEKFMLSIGMDQQSICDGAMSLVFNGDRTEEEQRKVCEKYELTMNEDLQDNVLLKDLVQTRRDLSEKEWKRVDKLVEDSKIG